MALIRGTTGLHPCPRCLIPHADQGDLSKISQFRTTQGTKDVISAARSQRLLGDKEAILKKAGLRDIDVGPHFYHLRVMLSPTLPLKNVFWKIGNSDPYAALSFDRLHTFPGGLFRHLWDHIQVRVNQLDRGARSSIDKMYIFCSIPLDALLTTDKRANDVPRWRGLTHFTTYLAVDFTDGSKWEHMSKVRHNRCNNIMYYSQTFRGICQICVPMLRIALGGSVDDRRLLSCIRAYVELDLLASFNVQTDETINYGRRVAKEFSKQANVSHSSYVRKM